MKTMHAYMHNYMHTLKNVLVYWKELDRQIDKTVSNSYS